MFANALTGIANTRLRPPQSSSFPSTFEISNEQSKFGTHSLKKNTNNTTTFVTLRRGYSNLFPTATENSGQGTVEFFYYKTGNPSATSFLFDIQEVSTEIAILLSNTGLLSARCRFGANTLTTSTVSLSNSAWHHIAITLEDNRTLTLWTNGNRIGFVGNTSDTLITSGGNWWRLGLGSNIGYFNEFRVSRSIRYIRPGNTTYTVPTARFVNDTDTHMLFHFDEKDDNTGRQCFDDAF
jgi:hypothetical protein